MRLRATRLSGTGENSSVVDPITNEDPSLDLNFAENKSLIDDVSGNNLISFTRASAGTYVGVDGLIKTASTNEARFDHNLATRESLGLLLEKATTNILLKSEKLNEWIVGSGSSVTANQAVAPDGTTTADRVQHGGGGSSWIRQDVLTPGVTYTVSVYAKAVTPGTNDQFTFDLGGLSSIFVATNEWQRFTFTGTASNASIYLNNGDDSFSTDVYFWGAQVEAGSFATSYISTDSSSVTRAADFAEITGTNFSNFFNQSEGTIFLENAQTATSFVPFAYDFSDGTTENSHRLLYISTINPVPIKVRTKVSNSNITDISFTAPSIGQFQKTAYGYKANDFALSVNGASVLSDTNGAVPTVINKVNIGNAFSNVNAISGYIKRLTYLPTRLLNATLQLITS